MGSFPFHPSIRPLVLVFNSDHLYQSARDKDHNPGEDALKKQSVRKENTTIAGNSCLLGRVDGGERGLTGFVAGMTTLRNKFIKSSVRNTGPTQNNSVNRLYEITNSTTYHQTSRVAATARRTS